MRRALLLGPDGLVENPDDEAIRKAAGGAKGETLWLDIEAPIAADADWLRDVFGFHPLALEDVVHTSEMPKVDEYEGYLFVVAHRVSYDLSSSRVELRELDSFLGKTFLVTCHEELSESLATVWKRAESGPDLLKHGAPYVLYELLQSVVGRFVPLLEAWEERVEALEDRILAEETEGVLPELLKRKREIGAMRRSLGAQLDALGTLAHAESPVLTRRAQLYFRDLYDQAMRVNTLLEVNQTEVTNAMEAYLSLQSTKLNRAMQGLSVVALVFVPFTCVTGFFGMNFSKLPALDTWWGPWAAMALLVGLAATLLLGVRRWFWFLRAPSGAR